MAALTDGPAPPPPPVTPHDNDEVVKLRVQVAQLKAQISNAQNDIKMLKNHMMALTSSLNSVKGKGKGDSGRSGHEREDDGPGWTSWKSSDWWEGHRHS